MVLGTHATANLQVKEIFAEDKAEAYMASMPVESIAIGAVTTGIAVGALACRAEIQF
jgi:ElaB/YqjD/DUF883 family membrane-anchored ribosome-binding protein